MSFLKYWYSKKVQYRTGAVPTGTYETKFVLENRYLVTTTGRIFFNEFCTNFLKTSFYLFLSKRSRYRKSLYFDLARGFPHIFMTFIAVGTYVFVVFSCPTDFSSPNTILGKVAVPVIVLILGTAAGPGDSDGGLLHDRPLPSGVARPHQYPRLPALSACARPLLRRC
jgi:hypothetical protein